jgi:hypothetical protein
MSLPVFSVLQQTTGRMETTVSEMSRRRRITLITPVDICRTGTAVTDNSIINIRPGGYAVRRNMRGLRGFRTGGKTLRAGGVTTRPEFQHRPYRSSDVVCN